MIFTYSPHHWPDRVEGHLYFDAPEGEPCTVTLRPAASASQQWLDDIGCRIANALNAASRGEIIEDAERELAFALAALSDKPDARELRWLAACASERAAQL